MNNKLRWGVLGAGQIAKVFCNAMRFSKTSELKAVASTQFQRGLDLSQFSGLSPRVEQSYTDLLQSSDIDAVYIANLNHQHYPLALASLRAGKHTLIEKPITLNEKELVHLVSVAEQEKRLLMEGFMYRCHPQLDRLRSHIEKQTIGRIKVMRASFAYQATFDPQSRLFSKDFGGGALYDVGCYPTSLAIWLSNILTKEKFPHSVTDQHFEVQGRIGSTGVVEAGVMHFQLSNGTKIQLQTSIIETLPSQVILEGSEGRITLKDPWLPSSPCRFADTPLTLNTVFEPAEFIIEQWNENKPTSQVEKIEVDRDLFTYEIDHFVGSIENLSSNKIPLQDSLANIRLLEQWRSSIHAL